MRLSTALLLVPAMLGILGCELPPPVARPDPYEKLRAEHPASILVVPAVNTSVDVTAADSFLATLTWPLVMQGYYVFPVYLVKRVMEDDGLSDANMVRDADPRRLASLFGADAVLYVTIDKWTAEYAVIATQVEVAFTYELKSGKTGESLWKEHKSMSYVPEEVESSNPWVGLIGTLMKAAATKAAPNYLDLAKKANFKVFGEMPYGPHHPLPPPQ
jgi:hypothetical protein